MSSSVNRLDHPLRTGPNQVGEMARPTVFDNGERSVDGRGLKLCSAADARSVNRLPKAHRSRKLRVLRTFGILRILRAFERMDAKVQQHFLALMEMVGSSKAARS